MRKGMHVVSGFLVALALSGCVHGLTGSDTESNRPSATFMAPVGYQEAYRRLDRWARQCHTSSLIESPNIQGNLYTDKPQADFRIAVNGVTGLLANLTESADGTSVKMLVWGHGIWDEKELKAAKNAIVEGSTTCRT